MTLKFALKTNSAIKKKHVHSDISKFAQNFQIADFKIQKGFLYFSKHAHISTLLPEPLTIPIPTSTPTYPAYLAPSSLLTPSPPPE